MKTKTIQSMLEPDIRGLRRKLASGTYRIASDKVAEAVMAWHMGPRFMGKVSPRPESAPASR